jgi:hypothetical protein
VDEVIAIIDEACGFLSPKTFNEQKIVFLLHYNISFLAIYVRRHRGGQYFAS